MRHNGRSTCAAENACAQDPTAIRPSSKQRQQPLTTRAFAERGNCYALRSAATMSRFGNSLELGPDPALETQKQQIAWQNSAQRGIDEKRDPLTEFRNLLQRLQGGSYALTKAFQALKKGRKGSSRGGAKAGVSRSDFLRVLREADAPLSDAQVDSLFRELDKDGKGQVSFDDVVRFVQGDAAEPTSLPRTVDWPRQHSLQRAADREKVSQSLRTVFTVVELEAELKKIFNQRSNAVSEVLLMDGGGGAAQSGWQPCGLLGFTFTQCTHTTTC
jgi:hypothetical protein